eukprot:s6007_g2.t1
MCPLDSDESNGCFVGAGCFSFPAPSDLDGWGNVRWQGLDPFAQGFAGALCGQFAGAGAGAGVLGGASQECWVLLPIVDQLDAADPLQQWFVAALAWQGCFGICLAPNDPCCLWGCGCKHRCGCCSLLLAVALDDGSERHKQQQLLQQHRTTDQLGPILMQLLTQFVQILTQGAPKATALANLTDMLRTLVNNTGQQPASKQVKPRKGVGKHHKHSGGGAPTTGPPANTHQPTTGKHSPTPVGAHQRPTGHQGQHDRHGHHDPASTTACNTAAQTLSTEERAKATPPSRRAQQPANGSPSPKNDQTWTIGNSAARIGQTHVLQYDELATKLTAHQPMLHTMALFFIFFM